MPKKKSDNLGKSEALAPDLTQDQKALKMMKELETKLKMKLISHHLPDGTIITTTKDRMEQLIDDHLHPITISR